VAADEVAEYARGQRIQQIVVGTKRKSAVSPLLAGSAVNRLLQLAAVPVAVIAGPSASPLERYALPAGLGTGLSLLLLGE
jgi:K+-sensing histidine kinase KdpD